MTPKQIDTEGATYETAINPRTQGRLTVAPRNNREVSLQSVDRSLAVIGRVLYARQLGGGGIEAVTRPKRRPVPVYRAPEALGVSLSFLIDGWRDGRSVDHMCRTVEQMAGSFVAGDPGPAKLIVRGARVPHCGGLQAKRRRWVMAEPPEPVDEWTIRRDRDGDLMRYAYTVTLLLDVDVDELERVRPRQRKPNTRTVRAKQGDTYEKIAHRELDSKRFGRRLAKLNGDNDPDKRLREGKKVVLPSGKQLDEWRDDLRGPVGVVGSVVGSGFGA